jgi:type VI secretion system secreted protein VgrG
MADFSKALAYTLKHEGGWVDDPDDPGGATNFGITLAVAQKHGIMTKEALRNISPGQVRAIYAKDYWRFGGFDDQRVATKAFDMCVNMGLAKGVKYLQGALNAAGASLKVDGVCGPVTTSVANMKSSGQLLELLVQASIDHYKAVIARRPVSKKYWGNWQRRALKVPNA